MKRSTFIVLMFAIAATAGLAIDISVTRSRHAAAQAALAAKAAALKESENSAAADDKSDSTATSVIRFVNNPSPAPPFLENDVDGRVVSTAGLRGKVVILNFWATWCPPCREEIPELISLASKYKDRLEIIGVSVDDDASPSDVKDFAREMGVNYSILVEGSHHGISGKYGGVLALPTSFVIDTQGRVVQKHVGIFPEDDYENEIRSLLGLPVHAKVITFADVGQVFLQNAAHATELPGVDFKGLTPEERKIALKRLNQEGCTCGCKLTIAQCRLNDDSCATSKELAAKIVKEVAAERTSASAKTD